MRQGSALAVVCLAIAACGAADERLDPGDLALRDLLGVQPTVVASWDEAQRAAARQVLAGGLAARALVTLPARLADDEAALVRAVAASDAALDDAGDDARGLVVVTPPRTALAVIDSPTATALLVAEPADPAVSLDLDPRAWTCPAQPCDLVVLAALAVDAAPGAPLVRVRPVAQLASIAALTVDGDGVPLLLVNPVVTAVGVEAAAGAGGSTGTTATGGARTAPALPPPPLTRGSWGYGTTRGACSTQVAADCATCLGGGLCEPVWGTVSGMEACTMLEADAPRSYDLVCVNLAVSLADVRACLQTRAPSCAIDADAIDLPAELENNANFVDNVACQAALDVCLNQLYGSSADDGCGGCDGCGCDGCDDSSGGSSCSLNDQNMDTNNCGGCGGDGGGCGGGNSGCNGGGGNGSCSVAGAGRRGPGVGVALVWVLLPVPVALRARWRARRAAPIERPDPA